MYFYDMLKYVFSIFMALTIAVPVLAQDDDWDTDVAPVVSAPAAQPSSTAPATEVAATPAPAPVAEAPLVVSREVPVRYLVAGDENELEAIFVKIDHDTVYLRNPTAEELKHMEELANAESAALQESNGQKVEDDEEEDEKPQEKPAEVIMTDAVKEAVAAQAEAQPAAPATQEEVDDGADDDFETALQKEDTRMKMVEIEKVEEQIRQSEIQDSIAAANANPFVKIFRMELKRLYNLEDEVMIDLSLSNYVVPEQKDEEEELELYPPGKANLLVVSSPEACSLFVNGIPLNQVAPDTIKNIKPGKYTISVMKVLKDVEWWGSAVVRINADSLNKVDIPVLRPSTRMTLNTDPEAVEVFVNVTPTEDIMPHYMTDIIVDNVRPQPTVNFYFRKVGYRDTTITTEIKAFMPNLVNVEMTPVLDDLEFIEQQKAFDAERSKRRVGRGLLWSSIAPFVAAGVLWYLAESDWSDAADKKKLYGRSAFGSSDTDKMVKENQDLNDSGDLKGGIAAGLGVLGIGLLTAGFILAF